MKFHELWRNILLVEFMDANDRQKVLRDSPWSFDRYLVLLKKVDGTQQACNVSLTEASFWVRIHDLPFMDRNTYIGKAIGDSIGHTEEVDLGEGEIEWGEYM